jgi:hypothetical protein
LDTIQSEVTDPAELAEVMKKKRYKSGGKPALTPAQDEQLVQFFEGRQMKILLPQETR